MSARPLPPPLPEPTRRKTPQTEPTQPSTQQRFFEMIRSTSKSPAFQNHLHGVMKKRWLRIAGIVIGVLLVLLIVLPFVIDVNSFRPKIESEATNALGRQVKMGDLSLSILSGTVGIQDISIADDPAFSKSPFVTAKSLKVGIELIPLIFSKELNVTRVALNAPQITLLKAPNGCGIFRALVRQALRRRLNLTSQERSG
jgi:AsmA-like protein